MQPSWPSEQKTIYLLLLHINCSKKQQRRRGGKFYLRIIWFHHEHIKSGSLPKLLYDSVCATLVQNMSSICAYNFHVQLLPSHYSLESGILQLYSEPKWALIFSNHKTDILICCCLKWQHLYSVFLLKNI